MSNNNVTSAQQYQLGAYGRVRYTDSKCAVRVVLGGRSIQCRKAPGHGPGALYCKHHAKRFEVKP